MVKSAAFDCLFCPSGPIRHQGPTRTLLILNEQNVNNSSPSSSHLQLDNTLELANMDAKVRAMLSCATLYFPQLQLLSPSCRV